MNDTCKAIGEGFGSMTITDAVQNEAHKRGLVLNESQISFII